MEVGEVVQGSQKSINKQWERLNIKIRDDVGDEIIIVLWNANVQNFSDKVGDTIEMFNNKCS